MKKYLLMAASLIAGTVFLTSCGDDDDNNGPTVFSEDVSNGVYVLGSGNMSSSISSEVTYYDYALGTSKNNMFANANGRNLGITANDMVVYGNKMYIAVTNENTIEVVDCHTLKSIKQINTTQLAGEEKGLLPRKIVADNGKIYVTTYGTSTSDWSTGQVSGNGYVLAIDTLNFALSTSYAVGAYPEGISIIDGYIFAANSNYGYGNASITIINPSLNQSKSITDENINNPYSLTTIGNDLYMLDYGIYDENYNQLNAGIRKISIQGGTVSVENVASATNMASDGENIYFYNAPYGSQNTSYGVYNTSTGAVSSLNLSEMPFSPAAIGVDPVNGYLIIASYAQDPDTGYPAYSLDGKVYVYDTNGDFVKDFQCCVGPTVIAFNKEVKYVVKEAETEK
jgi:hypothetical protein